MKTTRLKTDTARLFFAIELTEEIRTIIKKSLHSLTLSKADVHWIPSEKFHLTMRFLGEVKLEEIPVCLKRVQKNIASIHPFSLSLKGVAFFPPHHARTVALMVKLSMELAKLYHAIDQAVTASGFAAENRSFLPHITLGKIRRLHPSLQKAIEHLSLPDFPGQILNHVTLFRSDPTQSDTAYTVIEQLNLGVYKTSSLKIPSPHGRGIKGEGDLNHKNSHFKNPEQ